MTLLVAKAILFHLKVVHSKYLPVADCRAFEK